MTEKKSLKVVENIEKMDWSDKEKKAEYMRWYRASKKEETLVSGLWSIVLSEEIEKEEKNKARTFSTQSSKTAFSLNGFFSGAVNGFPFR